MPKDVKLIRAEFERDGFVIVRGLLPPEEVDLIRNRFEEIWSQGVPGQFEQHDGDFQNSCEKGYPRVIHPHRFDELSKRYLLDPRLIEIVRELLDDEPVAAQTMYYWKPPGTKGQAPHQDNLYLQADDRAGCLAAWVAIDPCDQENGGLILVPGSHKLELLCPGQADPALSFFDQHVATPEGLDEVAAQMEPGDVVFFSGNTIHGSGPNLSEDRCRRSFICHYIGSRSTRSAVFYNPLIRMNGEEFSNEAANMGSPCGAAFDGPH